MCACSLRLWSLINNSYFSKRKPDRLCSDPIESVDTTEHDNETPVESLDVVLRYIKDCYVMLQDTTQLL